MRIDPRVGKVASTLAISALLLGAWYAWHVISEKTLHAVEDEAAGEASGERLEVELSEAKFAAAGLKTEVVEVRPLQRAVTVPGRLAYDDTRHLEVRTATAGVITKMHVKLGDKIAAGQVLAEISSPEVGSARADEMLRASERVLAQRQADWDRARAEGVRKLVDAIRSGKAPAVIRDEFTQDQLGTARETLLTAYSGRILAQAMVEKLDTSGALPQRTVEERKREFDSASAALQATVEQSLFDADRAAQTSKATLADAERRLQIAAQKVNTLLGLTGRAADRKPDQAADAATAQELSLVHIHAPHDGWVEQKPLNENERVEVGTTLFVVADTSRLWLKADLRESQWAALSLTAGQELAVASPALTDTSLSARVLTMGREVDPATNAIPLVAEIDNPYGKLKPGLFVRVTLPIGKSEMKLVIPESAVADHDGQTFVFIDHGDRKYVRRDVKVAAPENGWAEVLSGLQPGEKVVTTGVFTLKSELLLEAEE